MSRSNGILSFTALVVFVVSMCFAQTPEEPMPGGRTPVDTKDSHIQSIACWAVEKMDETSDSIYEQALVDVVSGTQQVVAGVLYQLTIRVMDTACVKNQGCQHLCIMHDCNASPKVCQVSVWDKSWLEKRELTSASCS